MKKETEKELLELLRAYRHYKTMTAGFLSSFTDYVGMSIDDFIKWLESREWKKKVQSNS